MARARDLCCLASPLRGKASDADARRRHSSAACICCIGPHHKPSAAAPDADLSARLPLTSCCGSAGDAVRGRSTPRTPRTPCTPTARRLCGVRSRTPRRGQVGCFPPPHAAAAPAAASAGAPAAAARTPRTPTTPLGPRQQGGACCVRVPAQGSAKLGRRRSWFRSARQAVAQTTPRFRGAGRDSARAAGSNSNAVKVYDARHAEVEAAAEAVATATEEEETCSNDEYALLCREGFSREDVAAVTIQAYFRGHLVSTPPPLALALGRFDVQNPDGI
jgi:hypothetical protein